MKKIITLLFALAMAVVLGACSSNSAQNSNAAEGEYDDGGWTVPKDPAGSPIPSDAVYALEEIQGSYEEGQLEPVACLGTQLVAGTNYSVLCVETPADEKAPKKWVVAVVYVDFDGKSQLLGVTDFKVSNYDSENADSLTAPEEDEELPEGAYEYDAAVYDGGQVYEEGVYYEEETGGWYAATPTSPAVLPEGIQEAFPSLVDGVEDCQYMPIAYLGSNESKGGIQAVLCDRVPADGSDPTVCVVIVSGDSSNGFKLSGINDVDLSVFNSSEPVQEKADDESADDDSEGSADAAEDADAADDGAADAEDDAKDDSKDGDSKADDVKGDDSKDDASADDKKKDSEKDKE